MRHALAAAALAALLGTAAAFGYWAGSAASARRIERLEQSNRDLRASLDTLGEGLRQARAPLERRIHALEGALAANLAGAPAPPAPAAVAADPGAAPEPDESEAVATAPDAVPEPAEAEAPAGDAPAPRELARTDLPTAPEPASDPPPRAAAPAAAPVEAPKSRTAQADAALLPAVGAPPPPAPSPSPPAPSPPDPHCRELQDPEFVLDAGGAMLHRLGDRLALRALEEPAGLQLELGGPRGERYLLDSLPKHVAFACDDTAYIVSVCSIDGAPAQIHGVVWHPETWRNPCED